MTNDYLAHWISEIPSLINKLEQNPKLERYLRHTKPQIPTKRVDDDTWNQLTRQLAQ